MPTYDYECTKCDHTFEIFQSMNDDHLTKCPECGGKIKRLIGTGSGIIFKGSGFYETDYRSDSYNSAKAKDKSSETTSSSKKSTKSSKKKSSKKSKST